MSQKQITAIEDYLLGRIAALEEMVRTLVGRDKTQLPGWRAMITEDKLTLKKVREIASSGSQKGRK
jgi:hypothetical protein